MLRSSQQTSIFHTCVLSGCIVTQAFPVLLPFHGLPSCCSCCQASISSCVDDASGFSFSGLVLLLANFPARILCKLPALRHTSCCCLLLPYVLLLSALATTALCHLCHHRAASSLLFCPILHSRRAKYLLPQSCCLFSTLLLLITPCPIFLYYQLLQAVLATTGLCLLCHHRAVSSLLFCPILHSRNSSCARHFLPPPRCLLFLLPLRFASSTPLSPFRTHYYVFMSSRANSQAVCPLFCLYTCCCFVPSLATDWCF